MTLTVTKENMASCQVKLTIEVDKTTLNSARDKVVRDVRKQARIPGFRQGKAPRKMIERDYAGQIQGQLMQRVVIEAYQEAITQEDIHPLSDPDFDDLKLEEEPFSFTATLDVRPDIDLGDYKGLELTQAPTDVSDAEVEEVLGNLQERQADYVAAEDKAAAIGDVVVMDFVCTLDGEAFEGGSQNDFSLEIGKGQMIPGFEENLQGAKAGEEHDFDITFPEDYGAEHLAGQTAQAHATVKEVKLKHLPEIDDEFAKDISDDCETLEALREKVGADIRKHKEQQGQEALRNQALDKLLAVSTVDVPARIHERSRARIVQEAEQRMRQQNATDEQIAEQREHMMQHASEQAAKQIRTSFILDKIAHEEHLHASEDDVRGKIEEMAAGMGDAKALRNYFSNPDQRSNLRQQIEVEKVLEFLVEHATIVEGEPAPTDDAAESE